MRDEDGPDFEQETVEKTSDGKLLVLRRVGLSPLPYDDHGLYSRVPETEIVIWLLTAAGSGIIGNLAYDAAKKLVKKARALHKRFLATITSEGDGGEEKRPHHNSSFKEEYPMAVAIEPDDELRDYLVELAYDAIARYRNLDHKDPGKAASEISVFYTEVGTWAVLIRELGSSVPIMVEIDLRARAEVNRHRAVREVNGFPVRIWLSWWLDPDRA